MTNRGGDLFIVDNAGSDWSGLRYLKEWTEISKSFDIATGYFDVGALLELDQHWQKVSKIRILMGDEQTQKTKKQLLEALRDNAKKAVNHNLEIEKNENPFLKGAPAITEAIRKGQIECKVYNKSKFHAKAYITHSKLDVVGSTALVGSSNFTKAGLSKNIELNVQIQSPSEVSQLQTWFEEHWKAAKDISDEIIKVIDRHLESWTPYDVYSHSLRELFKNREDYASVWEDTKSVVFPQLDQYQKEAYWSMVKIAKQFGGAFLCDGVGLGKTFVGLMLIERMIEEKKHVVLFAPKGAKEGVWDPILKNKLPNLFGTDFSNLAVFSHTDLNREGEFPDRFRRVAEIADVIIVDEAHHFRNPGRAGDPETGEKRSRYYKFLDLINGTDRGKQLFLLTATPINNRLTDLRHLIELFTNREENHFSRTLGITNLRAYFNKIERDLRRLENVEENLSENIDTVTTYLARDKVFENLIVQRSRSYAIESQKKEHGNTVSFPKRNKPIVADYSILSTYGSLLDMIERAFNRADPLFNLVVYNPINFYLGDDEIDEFLRTRLRNVVTLIRTQFLKRFESSVFAFETSCDRLLKKLLAFLKKHCEKDDELNRYDKWIDDNEDILNYTRQQQLDLWGADEDEEDPELFPQELLESWEPLSRDEYDLASIINLTFNDLDELVNFLRETRKFEPEKDDKLKKLIRLLKTKDFDNKKAIIFSEFADTARYIERNLNKAGIEGVGRVDGGSSGTRYDTIRRFAPYYNSTTSEALSEAGQKEIRILVATDVLSEGLNLQDCTRLINYDINWNPVRLMQRIGRVDRRMDLSIEETIIEKNPSLAGDRGKITFWNFLPPNELNRLLSLYSIVTRKTLMISETLGIEGQQLLTPDDDYDPLREFNAGYIGERSLMENLQLELQQKLKEDESLKDRLDKFPSSIFSGRTKPKKGTRGVFFCFRMPRWENEDQIFSTKNGPCHWYLYVIESGEIVTDITDIIETVKCKPDEPRKCQYELETLIDIRDKVRKHIKNSYLKNIDAPLGVVPTLLAWMEIN